jgi:hypothetical protein
MLTSSPPDMPRPLTATQAAALAGVSTRPCAAGSVAIVASG